MLGPNAYLKESKTSVKNDTEMLSTQTLGFIHDKNFTDSFLSTHFSCIKLAQPEKAAEHEALEQNKSIEIKAAAAM